MDQGGEVRSQVDATVLSPLHCQSGAAATVRVGLQPGQFPATTGSAAACPALVADDAPRKADQDRGEDRASRALCDVSDGGSSDSPRAVPGDPATD